jgi:ADP-ribosylglycohydrolase
VHPAKNRVDPARILPEPARSDGKVIMIPTPWMIQLSLADLARLLSAEADQLFQEGMDVKLYQGMIEPGTTPQDLIKRYEDLFLTPRRADYPFLEPNSLEGIRSSRPSGPRRARLEFDQGSLMDRLMGAWLGRVAGCVLGKPVEGWNRKERIHTYLQLAGSYPLTNYVPRYDPLPEGLSFYPGAAGSFLGEIHGAPQDDDTDYTVLGLHLLETYGLGLKTSHVASEWLDHLAYGRTYTAERAAYRNLVLGVPVEQAASLLNPEREFIGARIRADIYGLACPSMPELAAEFAYQDAALSHTKNGIYSAMFLAAMLAWSYVTNDIVEIIHVGLSEIPAGCRLAASVQQVLAIFSQTRDWELAYDQLLPGQANYPAVHSINNMVWLVLALLYGMGDFEKTICTAVMCGFDTDCNGANAGAILGVLTGGTRLPPRWTDPLEDRLQSALAGYGELHISALARRTARLADQFIHSA